jgi:tetratricopeptide (TPR) repeat protein
MGERYQFPLTVKLLGQKVFLDEAVRALKSKLRLTPEPRLYRLLVDVYRRAGKWELALDIANKWLEAFPTDKYANYFCCLFSQAPLPEGVYRLDDMQPCPFVTIDNLLSADELDSFWRRVIRDQSKFVLAGMNVAHEKIIDTSKRDTLVLALTAEEKALIRSRLQPHVHNVAKQLGLFVDDKPSIEVKLTAHHHGGFFKIHHDGFELYPGVERVISWVYYFHQEPKSYRGGDLVLFDSDRDESDHQFVLSDYTRYIPKNNQVVFFPSEFYHGVTPVHLKVNSWSSGRFAIAGHARNHTR